MMMAGLVVLLVFSRLVGMGVIWEGVLGVDYTRVLKNATQETTELLEHLIMFAATQGYRRRILWL